jgi:hypothetical protein
MHKTCRRIQSNTIVNSRHVNTLVHGYVSCQRDKTRNVNDSNDNREYFVCLEMFVNNDCSSIEQKRSSRRTLVTKVGKSFIFFKSHMTKAFHSSSMNNNQSSKTSENNHLLYQQCSNVGKQSLCNVVFVRWNVFVFRIDDDR